MARRKIEGIRAVVTGASSGIGWELALQLAQQGANLVVTARREERLHELTEAIAKTNRAVHSVVGDITEEATRAAVLETAERQLGGLDLLVNNAGVGAIGPFLQAHEDRLRRIMEVNFFAPLELTRAAIFLLRKGHKPMIVNVGSVLGHRAVPKKSEYCASKFALHGFSDSLRCEVNPLGIDVLLVSPSTTASEFFDNVLEDEAKLPWRKLGAMSSQAVARKTIRAIRAGRHEIILTPGGKGLVWFDRLCPPICNRLVTWFG